MPLSLSLSQSTATIEAGDYVYLTATPSGGTAPYAVTWAHNAGSDKIVISAPNPGVAALTATISPVVPGSLTVTATVTDATSATSQATCAVTCTAASVVEPTLPASEVDFTEPTQSGTVWGPYTTWANITTALTNAALGDTILIGANGGVPIGLLSSLELKNKTTGTGWIVIKGDVDLSSCPSGTRMDPTTAASIGLPKLRTQTANTPVFSTTPGVPVHHYRIVGLDIGVDATIKPEQAACLVQLGWTAASDGAHATAANQPHHIILDRCYVHGLSYTEAGNAAVNARHGIGWNGANLGAIDCYVDEFHDTNSDSQAILALNGSGPYTAINCYLGASDECFMSGGGDARADELNPADITFRYCHFKKRLEWRTQGRRVKNIWELKNARRVLMEYCILENNWVGAQNGDGILIQNISNDSTRDSLSVQDVTVRYNHIKNVLQGFTLSGRVYEVGKLVTREATQRVKIAHNVFQDLNDLTGTGYPVRNFQLGGGQIATHLSHNSFVPKSGATVNSTLIGQNYDSHHLRLSDNIMSLGSYGWFGDGGTQGTAMLTAWWSTYTATGNVLHDAGSGSWGSSGAYPSGNSFPTGAYTTIGYTNPVDGGDWSLASGSTYKSTASDGTDPGADWTTLSAAIEGVEEGAPTGATAGQPVTNAAGQISLVVTGVSAGSATITATAGGATSNGSAITVISAGTLTISPVAGAYTQTGVAVALKRALVLSPTAGSYAQTGTDASLRVDRKLSAVAGVYAVTGSAATLSKIADRVLALTAGSHAISGVSVNLAIARVLSPIAGAYTRSGQAVGLLRAGEVAVVAPTAEAIRRRRHVKPR